MAKTVNESAKFVIRTTDGNRLVLDCKGGTVGSLVMAFGCLPTARRADALVQLLEEHTRITERESARALSEATAF